MKNLKKLASLALALIMALVMAVPAFASTEPVTDASITIQNTVEGKKYDIYRIFDATVNGDNVSYTVNSAWERFFTTGDGAEYLLATKVEGEVTQVVNGKDEVVENMTAEQLSGLNPITFNGDKYMNITNANIVDFANAALAYALDNNIAVAKTVDGTGADVTEAGLPFGYYMVYMEGASELVGSSASICSLNNVTKNATLKIKATTPTIDKTADDQNAVVKGVGDDVNFTIKGKVPDTTLYTNGYTYKITDTMSTGLTFDQAKLDKLTVKINDVDITNDTHEVEEDGVTKTVANVTKTMAKNGNGFELTIDVAQYQNNVGAEIVVSYSATVNENAIGATNPETNNATLTYSNNPANGGTGDFGTSTTIVKVYTATIDVEKFGKVNGVETKLDGAQFVLYKTVNDKNVYYQYKDGKLDWVEDKNAATVATSQKDTGLLDTKFVGLGLDTYYLEEIEAPTGFNKLSAPITIAINAYEDPNAGDTEHPTAPQDRVDVVVDENGNVTKTLFLNTLAHTEKVENLSGTELPETGGMGTTIFYTVGALLVAGAGILLVVKKRMGAAD